MDFHFDPVTLIPLGENLARQALPVLGTILGDAVPFPFNLFVGPAFAAIAAAMGQDPATATPASVKAAIEADPAAAAKLQPIEDNFAKSVDAAQKELDARLHDVQDARATEVSYAKAGSSIQYGAVVVSAIAIVGFYIVTVLIFTGRAPDAGQIGYLIIGALIAGYGTVMNYWLGSSKGSSDKTDALVNLAKQPQVVAGPGSHVSGGVSATKPVVKPAR